MAIWEKLFSKITFKNYPDTSTPINANNLNKMTDAIDGIDDRVVELNSNLSKFNLYNTTAINHGYIEGTYYIEWFFAYDNLYRLVNDVNHVYFTHYNGKEWVTQWTLNDKQNNLSRGYFTGDIDNVTADGSNNTLRDNSVVWVHNTDATGGHPVGVEYYVLETYVAITGIIIQRATQYIYQGAPVVYTRMYVNGEWSPEWAKLN